MPNTIVRLLQLKKELQLYGRDARKVLEDYFQDNCPELHNHSRLWLQNRNNVVTTAGTGLLHKVICDVEGVPFHKHRRRVSYFMGASLRICDDLVEEGNVEPQELYFFQNTTCDTQDLRMTLFHSLNSELLELLPNTFTHDFEGLIKKLNTAQEEGKRFSGDLDPKELIDIKNRLGGYFILLFYGMMFSDRKMKDVYEVYNLTEKLPSTREQAWFNFGAWFSRVDDLLDEKSDREHGIKQLATEGLTSWKSLRHEAEYVFNGLATQYPCYQVERVKQKLQPFTSRLIKLLI